MLLKICQFLFSYAVTFCLFLDHCFYLIYGLILGFVVKSSFCLVLLPHCCFIVMLF